MQLLTADVMELLINFYEITNIKYDIIVRNNNIYLRFYTGAMFELKSLKNGILQGLVEEYSDEICTTENGDVYNSTLYIASSDYNIMVITKNEMTDELLK